MSVRKVVITRADEEYEPPGHEIEVAVVGDRVYLTHYEGSDGNVPSTRKKSYEFPELRVHDLVAALAAHGVAVRGLLIASEALSAQGAKP